MANPASRPSASGCVLALMAGLIGLVFSAAIAPPAHANQEASMMHPLLRDLRSVTFGCEVVPASQGIGKKQHSQLNALCDLLAERLDGVSVPTRRIALEALPPAPDMERGFFNHAWLSIALTPPADDGDQTVSVNARWGTSFNAAGTGEESAALAVNYISYDLGKAATQILEATPLGVLTR